MTPLKEGDKLSPLGIEFDTAGGRQMMQCWNIIDILRLIENSVSSILEHSARDGKKMRVIYE